MGGFGGGGGPLMFDLGPTTLTSRAGISGYHSGPVINPASIRCKDGPLDMRFAVNKGKDKYRD